VGNVFNVGCGERISINSLWEAVKEATDAPVDAIHGPAREGDVRDSLASLDRARECLGYDVTVPLAEGLKKTVDWLGSPGSPS
jgi:UDP-N-acetylglucosamine 4-epimerase